MEEVFARRDMLTREQLRDLATRSDLRGAVQLVSHLGAIAITGTLLSLTWGSWVAVPVFLAHGVLINFLYAGQHELSHNTVFTSKALNEWFGRLFGFILFYPRDFDQIQHYAHHRYTQLWEKDGELYRPPYTLFSYLMWLLGPSYWYSRIARILRFTFGVVKEEYIPERRKADVIREARYHVAGYALIAIVSIATGSWLAITHWIAPMVLTKLVHQLQNTIEHLGLPHVDDITLNTRSTRTSALMRWLAWQMQYHTAHHAFPGVPCYNLKRLHQTIFLDHGRKPEEMTYFDFQKKAIGAFLKGHTEADYPADRKWISDDVDLAPVAPADNVNNPLGLKLED